MLSLNSVLGTLLALRLCVGPRQNAWAQTEGLLTRAPHTRRAFPRIEASFQLTHLEGDEGYKSRSYFSGGPSHNPDAPLTSWNTDAEKGLWLMRVGDINSSHICELMVTCGEWAALKMHPLYQGLLARGLYRLGIEDLPLLASINSPLSAHERVELRLAMPRKFWPQTWLDELSDLSFEEKSQP